MTLNEIYLKHKKGDWPDKGSVHSYIEVYEELFSPYRNRDIMGLEIGLMSGESLRMWNEYFDGVICGIDCDKYPINGLADLTKVIDDGLPVFIGDAATYRWPFKFDVVIEDAAHNIEQQVAIYNNMKDQLNPGAIYVIEDVQDIDKHRLLFESLDDTKNIQILDRRHIKNRYDDVLIVITDK